MGVLRTVLLAPAAPPALRAPKTASGAGLTPVCLQADSPEDMHSWIRAVTGAVQALRTRPRVGHVPSASCLVPNEERANVQDIY